MQYKDKPSAKGGHRVKLERQTEGISMEIVEGEFRAKCGGRSPRGWEIPQFVQREASLRCRVTSFRPATSSSSTDPNQHRTTF